MPGRRAEFDIEGAKREIVAQDLIGRVSAPVKVPREMDFGIDYFCQLFGTGGARSISVEDLFSLQVKGSEPLKYGGVRDGKWRNYEIEWLRSQAVPILLARVDHERPTLNLYNLGPIWRVLWQTSQPYEIVCATSPQTSEKYVRAEAQFEESKEPFGDQRTWLVPIGPPFLTLTHEALRDDSFAHNARILLRTHIAMERKNLLRFQSRVAIHHCVQIWHTNCFEPRIAFHKAMYWSLVPGENIDALVDTVTPALVNLGVHLQWQNNSDAYKFIGALDWIDRRGGLDEMDRGLLRGLIETRDRGVGPRES